LEKLHRVGLRRRFNRYRARKVPASNDRELRRRRSKAKKWKAHESFQAAFEQWSHLQRTFPVKSGMRFLPADATRPIEFHAYAPGSNAMAELV
jgi:hypothetical protein